MSNLMFGLLSVLICVPLNMVMMGLISFFTKEFSLILVTLGLLASFIPWINVGLSSILLVGSIIEGVVYLSNCDHIKRINVKVEGWLNK